MEGRISSLRSRRSKFREEVPNKEVLVFKLQMLFQSNFPPFRWREEFQVCEADVVNSGRKLLIRKPLVFKLQILFQSNFPPFRWREEFQVCEADVVNSGRKFLLRKPLVFKRQNTLPK